MFTLGEIEQSEHNLLGAISEDDFLEALDTAPPQAKKKFFKKMQMQSRVQTTATSSRSRAEFEKRTSDLVAQYNELSPTAAPDVKVNGAFTLGENIGDLGGMNIAIKAYQIALNGAPAPEIDGLSAMQRFFLSWAQCWRRLIRPEEARLRVATDPHSPDELRCNQIVRNLDEFYDAFDVKENDALYLSKRVKIWQFLRKII